MLKSVSPEMIAASLTEHWSPLLMLIERKSTLRTGKERLDKTRTLEEQLRPTGNVPGSAERWLG